MHRIIKQLFNSSLIAIFSLLSILIISGCADDDGSPSGPNGEQGRIHLNNDPASLSQRMRIADGDNVTPLNGVVEEGPDGVFRKGGGNAVAQAGDNVVIMLRAEVDPPEHNGQVLRATHVDLFSGFAYVSYNVEGRPYIGGVEVFDISNMSYPRIVSQALFDETDISAVAYANQRLYLAEATGDDGFDTPAVLEEILMQGEQLTDSSRRVDISSYVATGVAVADDRVYVTSGTAEEAEGGLTVLNQQTLESLSTETFDDARDVDYNDDVIVVMQGTPGRLQIYDRGSGDYIETFEPGGAGIAESKSTIDVDFDRIYMAAGDEGMKVVSLDNGEILTSFDRIELEGVDPSLTVTNAVTVNENLVLMANGEAGLYVAMIDEEEDELELVGFMDFQSTSANYVKAQDNMIFLASGAGGLKILEAVYYDPEAGNFLTLGEWDRQGVPFYLEQDQEIIGDNLMEDIETVFPERQNLLERREDFFTDGVHHNAVLGEEAEVFVTFVYEGAGWTNTLGFYTYPEGDPPESTDDLENMTIVFPNVSFEHGGGGLSLGDKVKLSLGTFTAGTEFGYFFIAQGWRSRHGGEVTRGLYIHYTNIEFNAEAGEGCEQHHVLAGDQEREVMILTFEDTRRDSWMCDNDFNEAIFMITTEPAAAFNTDELPQLVDE